MHRDHGHSHDHPHGHDHDHDHAAPGPGHNSPRRAVQWQTPHDPHAQTPEPRQPEPDFDLIEAAFIDGFARAEDPTSFLRLARVPFAGKSTDGATLNLLRVETEDAVDVGSITPHLGGGSMSYKPLPAKMASRRRRLAFIYFDGKGARRLTFAEVLALDS